MIFLKRVFDLYTKEIFYPIKISICKLKQDSQAIHYISEGIFTI